MFLALTIRLTVLKLNQILYFLKDSQANEAIVENVVVPLASTITDSEAQTILIQKRLSLITNNAQFPSDEEALLVEEIEEIIEGEININDILIKIHYNANEFYFLLQKYF